MSVVLNVLLCECNEPTSGIVQPIGTHGGEVMYFGCVCFRGKLGFLNCDDICMCVVNMQFELIWCECRWFRTGSGGVGWCYECVSCESGFFVYLAGLGNCILCLADNCAP